MHNYTNASIFIPKAVGVKEYAYDEDINYPNRQSMEDGYFIVDNILQDASQSILFGILDGHGGVHVVKFVQQNFPKIFVSLYKQFSKSIPELLDQCYARIDQELQQKVQCQEIGCTASIGLIRLEGAKRILYFSNVGDSHAYLFDEDGLKLTSDHKPSNPTEKQRILQQKGTIIMDRIGGILAVSRALGDLSFKRFGLSPLPDLKRIELRAVHKWLIVASDGLWDVVSPAEIGQLVKYKENADEISKCLLKLALKRESKDNISIICLKILL